MDKNNYKILIVDDTPENVQVLGRILSDENFELIIAVNGLDALKAVDKVKPDLILLDILMPKLDGFETCKKLKASELTKDIPIIFLTAKVEPEDVSRGFELGAVDYIAKPFNIPELIARVNTHLEIKNLRNNLERTVEQRTIELRSTFKQLKKSHFEIINRLGLAAEFRDNETGTHLTRMSQYCAIVGKAMELSDEQNYLLVSSSVMHDVGKIGIPDNILLKPGKLTDDEFDIIKKHTTLGCKLLSGIDSDLLKKAEKIALTHHEKYNGNGYPNGLVGDEIPIEGRIVAVCDVFDALTSIRPYKKAWDVERVVKLITSEKGQHFDPYVVDKFLSNLPEILEVKNKFNDAAV